MRKAEAFLESLVFRSRWLLAPFFFGLIVAIVAVLVKFVKLLLALFAALAGGAEHEVILIVLTLIDSALVASLLLIIAFSGYENFVSKIHTEAHEDRPEWMGKVDFSGLKLKLVASIVAISGIELLKAFVNTGGYSNTDLAWKVGIHGMLVVSGVLLALMDRIAASAKH